MEILEKLFTTPVRAKLLKLFLMSPEMQFSVEAGCRQTKLATRQFVKEAERLVRLQILKSEMARMVSEAPGRRKSEPRLVRIRVFSANKDFPLFAELRNLIIKSAPHAKGQLAAKLRRLGSVKLAILAGVFIDNPTSRVDLLIVADSVRKSKMTSFIQWLETTVGKELSYVAMSSQEYKYRQDMYDRFLRDVLESPHETVINKLGA